MVIVSHTHRFILLSTRKTASSSVEASLAQFVGPADWIAITKEIPRVEHPFFRCFGTSTTWVPKERELKKWLARTGMFPALQLRKHLPAAIVREIVGEDVWQSYYKFAVDRDPWDRFISLWRWRTRSNGLSLDAYLDEVEHLAREYELDPSIGNTWSNWPVYAIGDDLAVNHVVRYERLIDDLRVVLDRLSLDWDGQLSHFKRRSSGDRSADKRAGLTQTQIDRIGQLYAREAKALGYRPPPPSS